MTTIHYQDSVSNGFIPPDALNPETLDLQHFAEACGQSPEWVLALIEHGILPQRTHTEGRFSDEDLTRAQRAHRLQRDFDASFSAVAMMVDLIDEVQQLRRQVKHSHFK